MKVRLVEEMKNIINENGSVSLPGIGEIKSAYLPAKVDLREGVLAPPSSVLQFFGAGTGDDGQLIDYLCAKYALTPEEAGQEAQYFLSESFAALEAGRPLTLPEIGRFFKSADNKIQFLPDANRTDPESFGLPKVGYSIVPRMSGQEKKTSAPEVKPLFNRRSQAANAPGQSSAPVFTSASAAGQVPDLDYIPDSAMLPNRYSPTAMTKYVMPTVLPGAIVALLLALSAWIFLSKNSREPFEDYKKIQKTMAHVNVKPAYEETPSPDYAVKNTPPVAEEAEKPAAADPYIDKKETSPSQERMEIAARPASDGNEAVALIGAFRKKGNADRLTLKIREAGFVPSVRKKNGVSYVDCAIPYTDSRDLRHKLNHIRQMFGPEINLIRK